MPRKKIIVETTTKITKEKMIKRIHNHEGV